MSSEDRAEKPLIADHDLRGGSSSGRHRRRQRPRRQRNVVNVDAAVGVEEEEAATVVVVEEEEETYAPCDLCLEIMPPFSLSCGHTFCDDCIRKSVNSCSSNPRKNFKALFCPFRCGHAFNTCSSLPFDLSAEVQTELEHMSASEDLMMKQAEVDGFLSADVLSRFPLPDKLQAFVSEKYATYSCSKCRGLFAMRNLCGAAGDAEDAGAGTVSYLCEKCTIKGGARVQIKLWCPGKQSLDDHPKSLISSEDQESYEEFSTSIDNTAEQQSELEVLLAVYPDLLEIIHPIPATIGDPCATIMVDTPQLTGSFDFRKSNLLPRLQSQLRLRVLLPSGYPAQASPIMRLVIGDLSAFEFDGWMRRSLVDRMVCKIILHKNLI